MAAEGREIDLGNMTVEQLTNIKSQHEMELQELNTNWRTLKEAESRFNATKTGLTTLAENEGAEIFIPLTASLYVPGTIIDTSNVLVDIGTGYFLEKDVPEAQNVLDRKIDMITNNAQSLHDIARQKQKNLETIVNVMREKLRHNAAMANANATAK